MNALTSSWGHAGVDDNDAQAGKIVVLPWVENQRSEVRIMGDGTYTGALPAQPGQKQAPMLAVHMTQDPIVGDDFSPAISRGAKDGMATAAVLQNTVVRRLTPTETERLQGFPDGWTCLCDEPCSSLEPKCPMGKRYAAMGDAVTVPVAQWLGTRLGSL